MFSRMKRAACLSPHDIKRRVYTLYWAQVGWCIPVGALSGSPNDMQKLQHSCMLLLQRCVSGQLLHFDVHP
jgi:hypothetical protein